MKRRLNDAEIKEYSFEILKEIKRVCNKLSLNYFLDSGTLLGAIRHNGFIPWDDDIDIAMPRSDYNIFIKQFNKHCNKRYKLKCIENSLNYAYPYAKVFDTDTVLYEHGRKTFGLGLSIDIFVIDGYPDEPDEQGLHFNKVLEVFNSYADAETLANFCYSFNVRGLLKNLKIFYARTFLQRFRAKKVIKNAIYYDIKKCNYAGINVCVYYHPVTRCMKKNVWNQSEHIFENDLFPIPLDFDSVLKSYYGKDYMIPPPENKRNSSHRIEVYLKK